MPTLSRYRILLALVLPPLMACDQLPKIRNNRDLGDLNRHLGTELEAAGKDALLLAPDSFIATLPSSIQDRAVGFKEFDAAAKALRGQDEEALAGLIKNSRVKLILLPRTGAEAPAGSLHRSMVKNLPLRAFQPIYLSRKAVLVRPAHPAFEMDEGAKDWMLLHARATLEEKPPPSGPVPPTLEATDTGYVKVAIGLLRGGRLFIFRASTARSALEAVNETLGKIKVYYNDRYMKKDKAIPLKRIMAGTQIEVDLFGADAYLADRLDEDVTELLIPGIHGVRMEVADKRDYVLPSYSVRWSKPDALSILGRLCARNELDEEAWRSDELDIRIFTSINLMESKPGGPRIDLLRGLPWPGDGAKGSIESSLAWLKGRAQADGTFLYKYFPVVGRELIAAKDDFAKRYSLPRHNLATLGLLQGYRLTKDQAYLQAAKRAAAWMASTAAPDDKGGKGLRWRKMTRTTSVATAVMALADLRQADPTATDHDPLLAELLAWLRAQQKKDGHFDSRDPTWGTKLAERDVDSWEGQAALALLRSGEEEDRYRVRRAAEAWAQAFAQTSRTGKGLGDPADPMNALAHGVAWQIRAMAELRGLIKDDRLNEPILTMGRWLLARQHTREALFPDLVGGFVRGKDKQDLPSYESAMFLWALADVLDVARQTGDQALAQRLEPALKEGLAFLERLQFQGHNIFYLARGQSLVGAFRFALNINNVRIDYVYTVAGAMERVLSVLGADQEEVSHEIQSLPDGADSPTGAVPDGPR